jgi:hypothetical protein
MDTILHVGLGHPNLLWVLVTAIITFAAGLSVGIYHVQNNRQSVSDADTPDT